MVALPACDWLETQGYSQFGVLGTSLGSCYAFIAAAFDTRVSGMPALTGRASWRIARLLTRRGCSVLLAPESFLVGGQFPVPSAVIIYMVQAEELRPVFSAALTTATVRLDEFRTQLPRLLFSLAPSRAVELLRRRQIAAHRH